MKKICLTALLAAGTLIANAQDYFTFGTAQNPKGESVLVDSHGLIIKGQRVIPVMGEMHYSRVPEKDWLREIRKMRAGGISTIATYVFWIHHENTEGVWDWSGNRNLHHFLELCKQEDMPVVLRVGPFCHGEAYHGGFPDWLVNKAQSDKNYKLRSEAPGFIAATQRLYSNIYAQVSDMLWKHGGPIIGVQIENECRGPWSYYMKLKDMAVSIGFDVPFYTRTGWPKLNGKEEFGKLLPLYGDYADGFWDRVLTDMPGDYKKAFIMKDTRISSVIATETFGTNQDTKMDSKDLKYPYLTCELGGGMMPAYHRRINISGNEAMPLAICKIGSGSNLPGYYMYHGGSNPYNAEHTMAECQNSFVTNYNDMPHISYDFQSPLGEMGQLNEEAFHQTRWFHQFLADWGAELSTLDVDTLSDHYARRGAFEFRNDYVRILNEGGKASVTLKDWKLKTADATLSITTNTVQPFAKIEDTEGATLYFITSGNDKPRLSVNGKTISPKLNKPFALSRSSKTTAILGVVLSPKKARTAFVIDGKMHYAANGGILYKGDDGAIIEENWIKDDCVNITLNKTADAKGLRVIKMGKQKVAEQPSETDYDNAAKWNISFTAEHGPSIKNETLMTMDLAPTPLDEPDDYFLSISYQGDVARVYADGKLVMDNFWNGKPMLVRLSDLAGKKVELRILPLGKDYPIYLQTAQRQQLEKAEGNQLLSLDEVKIIKRNTTTIK